MTNEIQTNPPEGAADGAANPRQGSTANVIYILYLVSLVVGITGLIGVVMAYVNRTGAPDWVQSHYRWQIRTFWMALLYSAFGLLLSQILIGYLVILFTVIWLIVRVVKGMQALGRGEPLSDVESWLFG